MRSLNACLVWVLMSTHCKILSEIICLFTISFDRVSLTQKFSGQGLIDPPALLNSSKVYAYSGIFTSRQRDFFIMFLGSGDTVVQPTVVRSLVQYYQNFIPSSSIKGQFNIASQHCLPTTNFGSAYVSFRISLHKI